MPRLSYLLLAILPALAACAPPPGDRSLVIPDLQLVDGDTAPTTPEGSCWDTLVSPDTPDQARWFRIPCDGDTDEGFTASLQRALAARGHYSGPITGKTGPKTRLAIRSYQLGLGLDSDVLSYYAAQRLGLLPYDVVVAPG